LADCMFESVVANDCQFDNAKLSAAQGQRVSSLEKAAFTRCSFLDAELRGASVSATHFVDCDLRRVSGLKADNTVMRGTVLSPGAPDVWSVLRRRYTGANMVFNLVALVIFFTPFIFEAIYWSGVNRLQRDALRALSAAEAV